MQYHPFSVTLATRLVVTFTMILDVTRGVKFLSPDGDVYYWTHSGLPEVPADIPDGATLVDLGHNNITELKQDSFIRLTSCTNLNLWFNHIGHIEEDSFKGLGDLKELFLSNNKLIRLASGTFNGLKSLVHLHLSGNGIEYMDDGVFTELKALEELWMSDNEITTIGKDALAGLDSLIVLKIWANKVKNIEAKTFTELGRLKELWLSENLLENIGSEMFTGLEQLEVLNLAWNELVSIETDALTSMENLKTLDLRYNYLTKLNSSTFHGLQNLENLVLSHNNLVTMEPAMFSTTSGLPRPLYLSLDGNPLQCDCSLCWMKEEEKQGSIIWNTSPDGSPECLAAGQVDWVDFSCSDSGNISQIFHSMVVLVQLEIAASPLLLHNVYNDFWNNKTLHFVEQLLLFLFFKIFGGYTCPFLGPLVPLFWISGDVSSGVQSQSGFCLIRFLWR